MYGSCANMHENHKHTIIIMPSVSALKTVSNITTEKLSVAVQRGNCALIGPVWVLNNSVLPTCIALYVLFSPHYTSQCIIINISMKLTCFDKLKNDNFTHISTNPLNTRKLGRSRLNLIHVLQAFAGNFTQMYCSIICMHPKQVVYIFVS